MTLCKLHSKYRHILLACTIFLTASGSLAALSKGFSSSHGIGIGTIQNQDITILTDRPDIYPLKFNILLEIQYNFNPTLGMSLFTAFGPQSTNAAFGAIGISLNIVDGTKWYVDADLGIGYLKPEIYETLNISNGEHYYLFNHFSLTLARKFGSRTKLGLIATHGALLEDIVIENESYNGAFSTAFLFFGITY